MIISSELLKKYCNTILQAVDSNELSAITETLQIKAENNTLTMDVTNREYYARVLIRLDTLVESFHATVNANVFLKLINQITTKDIELTLSNTSLVVKGNGIYKLPLIFDNDKLLELPEIKINNVTNTLKIHSSILQSILQYNSKELLKGTISKPVQRLYYIDDHGAITFTSGACVNSFMLEKPIKILLNDKLVKLFKLFKDTTVQVTLGFDPLSDTIVQTKIKFESDDVILTAILSCDETLINSVPVNAIRNRANTIYPYSVTLNKNYLLQTINRLMLFNSVNGTKDTLKPYSVFDFNESSVTIWDVAKVNSETLNYSSEKMSENYSAILDLVDLKSTLDICTDEYITLNFGDHQAFVLSRGSVKNVIPEVKKV